MAGLILSESEFSHQALSDMVPLRDVFGLLFFVTVGMLFDPHYALDHIGQILVLVVAIILGKAIIFGAISLGFGYRKMAPWVIGLGLSQIGEFSFVLARTGFNANLVSKSMYDLVLTTTVLTMALSPMVSALALPLGRAWKNRFGADDPALPVLMEESAFTEHVVVAGYGRAGRAVARGLRQANIPCLIVESNYLQMATIAEDGFVGLWGDISRDEILRASCRRNWKSTNATAHHV